MQKKFISSIWNFDTTESSTYLTHGAFRWYGKLVPQLVARVLDLYTTKGDNVIANFSGSGTILLESLIRGLNCTATDINDLALLISRVKTQYFTIDNLDDVLQRLITNAKAQENLVTINHLYEPQKWYNASDAHKLVSLKERIANDFDGNQRDFFLGALMSVVRDCSNIDSRCVNHIVVNKTKSTREVYSSFTDSARELYKSIQELSDFNFQESKFSLIKQSADDMSYAQNNSIDLVFSHPPYLNAVNYYNIYRLCTDLLGSEYETIRKVDFSSKKLGTYLGFMKKSFEESFRVLKPGKRCVVVIGDIRYLGNLITLQVDFINILRSIGFDIEDTFIWELNKKAGMSLARRGNYIDHNYIIVAKKG